MNKRVKTDETHNEKDEITDDIIDKYQQAKKRTKVDFMNFDKNDDKKKQKLPNGGNNGNNSNKNKDKKSDAKNKTEEKVLYNKNEDKKPKHRKESKNKRRKTKSNIEKNVHGDGGAARPSKYGQIKLKLIVDKNLIKVRSSTGKNRKIDPINIANDSELGRIISNKQVLAQGDAFKEKFFFSCFWNKRYFVLTIDGTIRYYNDKNQTGKVFNNLYTVKNLHLVNRIGRKHPFRILFRSLNREDVMAFDAEHERDIWAAKLCKIRKNLI